MYYGLYLDSYGNVTIDNCEFENNKYAIYRSSGGSNSECNVTDSIFLDNEHSIYSTGTLQIENNYFSSSNADWTAINAQYGSMLIKNNTFIYEGDNLPSTSNVALKLDTNDVIVEHNDFSDYYTAIRSQSESFIKYNTFTNHQKAISITTGDDQEINYNNFINNVYSIVLDVDGDQENCNYNYYGSSSTNQALISQQFGDICNGHSIGMFIPFSVCNSFNGFLSTDCADDTCVIFPPL